MYRCILYCLYYAIWNHSRTESIISSLDSYITEIMYSIRSTYSPFDFPTWTTATATQLPFKRRWLQGVWRYQSDLMWLNVSASNDQPFFWIWSSRPGEVFEWAQTQCSVRSLSARTPSPKCKLGYSKFCDGGGNRRVKGKNGIRGEK